MKTTHEKCQNILSTVATEKRRNLLLYKTLTFWIWYKVVWMLQIPSKWSIVLSYHGHLYTLMVKRIFWSLESKNVKCAKNWTVFLMQIPPFFRYLWLSLMGVKLPPKNPLFCINPTLCTTGAHNTSIFIIWYDLFFALISCQQDCFSTQQLCAVLRVPWQRVFRVQPGVGVLVEFDDYWVWQIYAADSVIENHQRNSSL